MDLLDLYMSTYDEDEDMSRLIASNRRLHLLLMNRTYLTYVDIETSGITLRAILDLLYEYNGNVKIRYIPW